MDDIDISILYRIIEDRKRKDRKRRPSIEDRTRIIASEGARAWDNRRIHPLRRVGDRAKRNRRRDAMSKDIETESIADEIGQRYSVGDAGAYSIAIPSQSPRNPPCPHPMMSMMSTISGTKSRER